MDIIKQTYRNVEITYVERSDQWNFTANGRERNAPSLLKAKESIDRALDHERKEKPWKPFTAFLKKYSGNDFEAVTITSEADPGRYNSGLYFWTTKQNGEKKERSRESATDLYIDSPENQQRIARWREIDTQIDALTAEQRSLVDQMTKVERPASAKD